MNSTMRRRLALLALTLFLSSPLGALACASSDDGGGDADDGDGTASDGGDGTSDGDGDGTSDGDDDGTSDGDDDQPGPDPGAGPGNTCTITVTGDDAAHQAGMQDRSYLLEDYLMGETGSDLITAAWAKGTDSSPEGSAVGCQHALYPAGQPDRVSFVVSFGTGILDGRLEDLVPVSLNEGSNNAIDRGAMIQLPNWDDPGQTRIWLCGVAAGPFSISVEAAEVAAEIDTAVTYRVQGAALGQCYGSLGTPGVVTLFATYTGF